ncbi:MAG: Uncharacterized protein G01um1014106_173 [Parcubacteria group bacterium Gr01-1014_106]|nr:MAG: Uncharacterized protein G01um1014106_173 [Parcubacteria group bacterium Gr01-1014_106]
MGKAADERATLTINASDDLPDMLEKIRRAGTQEVILDCGLHPILREDPFVRRLLKATAADFGKDVTFRHTDATTRAGVDTRGRQETHARGTSARIQRQRILPRRLSALPTATWKRFGVIIPRGRIPLAVFAAITGILLTGVVTFVLPRARIQLALVTEPFTADFTVWLDTSAVEPRAAAGAHPARLFRAEEVVEQEFSVETIVQKGARAEGSVDIVNETTAAQGIKARSRLKSASGVVLRTQRDVIIPAQGRAAVRVQAEEGGNAGNLEPQRLTFSALPAASQRILYGAVVQPLRGGTDNQVHQVSAADIERGSAELRASAERTLRERIAQETRSASFSAPPERRTAFSKEELTRIVVNHPEVTPAAGTEASTFRLKATVRGEAFIADAQSFNAFIADLIRQRIAEEKEPARASTLDDLRVVDIRWDHGRAEFSLHVDTPLVPRIDLNTLRSRLEQRTADDATAFLRAIPGVRSAEVRLSPVWVKRIPGIPRNIHIETTTE